MNKKIFIIEDDQSIRAMVHDRLVKEGYTVTAACDGEEALSLLHQEKHYDLVLLDLMLPKIDGLECLRLIRQSSMVPIIIMSAKDEDVDKALGLGMGADDYIAKPFSMIELVARIKALIRRTSHYSNDSLAPNGQIITVGDLRIDVEGYTVKKHNISIKLTAIESKLLHLFVTRPKQVFTKEQLYHLVWEADYVQDMNVINVHIRRLREKIEDDPSNPRYIQTLWGIGYRLGEL